MDTEKQGRTKVYLPLLFAIILIAGIFIGLYLSKHQIGNDDRLMIMPKSGKLSTVLEYISNEYVDSVNLNQLSDEAIELILKKLDPHSIYIPSDQVTSMNEPLEGNFSGIGVEFNMTSDTVVIVNTIPNGPSALLGILPGDRIIKVNGYNIAGVKFPSDSVVRKLKGPSGTKVQVTIFRKPSNILVYEITRDKIPLYSIDVSYMLNDKTGYIKLSQFARTTGKEFETAVSKLKPLGMKNLILDLRGNGGGYLEEAVGLADQFLENGRLIVYTEGRAHKRQDYFSSGNGLVEKMPVVILIDEFSASASEIVAGAIQDNDQGTIIGRRSFGKGLVQEPMVFADKSMIRLTIARYYTPTGRCIQKPYSEFEDYYHDIYERFKHHEMESADSMKINDSTQYLTPGGKIVYGGGGIIPDVFIPIDTVGFTQYFSAIREKGLIYKFAFDYSDKNRKLLSNFQDYTQLVSYLNNSGMITEWHQYVTSNGVKHDPIQWEKSEHIILTQLNAYIVRNFFKNEGYYPVIAEIDQTLKQSIIYIEKQN